MLRAAARMGMLALAPFLLISPAKATQIQVYGAWHCGNDYCTWASVRDMADFDTKNHWLVDRGDGTPSVNLVVLSFVNPLKLLNLTNDSQTSQGIPIGMKSAVIRNFASHNNQVVLSVGGITIFNDSHTALAMEATQ